MSTNESVPHPTPLRGSCLCGAVRYEVAAGIDSASHCHCGMCRKAHGAAFATYASVPAAQFRITAGAQVLGRYASSPGVTRSFCTQCGSPITWASEHGTDRGSIDVAVGTLDAPPATLRQWHIFTASKAPWYGIDDGLPQWPERRPRDAAPSRPEGGA